jgi:hypothetical protein
MGGGRRVIFKIFAKASQNQPYTTGKSYLFMETLGGRSLQPFQNIIKTWNITLSLP